MMYLDEYIFRCIAKSMNLEVPKRPTIWEGGRQGVHVIIETESLKCTITANVGIQAWIVF
jgi:hypothetical protein